MADPRRHVSLADPRPFWEYIRHPYSPGWLDPFHVQPVFRPRGNDPFGEMERLLRHLPLFLDEDKVRSHFGGDTSMAVEKGAEKDPNNFTCEMQLQGFDPKDVKVRTIGRKVIVEAVTEDDHKDEEFESFSRREFSRSTVLPVDVDADNLTSTLSTTGILKLKAPYLSLPAPAEEKEVPISVEKMDAIEGN